MTTLGGREASVRVVPFLVANQVMFLAALTSAICVAPARWYIFGLAAATGLYVFWASAVCFHSLYMRFGDRSFDKYEGFDGRTLVLVFGLAYFVGCSLGLLAWTCGHSGFDFCNDTATAPLYLAGDLLSTNIFVILAVILKVRYLSDTPRTLTSLVPGLKMNNGGRINRLVRPTKGAPGMPMIAPPPQRQRAGRGVDGRPARMNRRPSLSNVAIDDTNASFRPPPEWQSDSFDSMAPQMDESNLAIEDFQRTFNQNTGSTSPEMGIRALRGQSGFAKATESGLGFQSLGAPLGAQIYQPPNTAYAPLGAPAATAQAQAIQEVLQLVQDLVVAHANVPSNAAHWSAVLPPDSGGGPRSKVREYESEVASAMEKLSQARAEMLELAAADRVREGEAKPPPGGDGDGIDAQEPDLQDGGFSGNLADAARPLPPKPQLTAKQWLQSEEEADNSTPSSPLFSGPASRRARLSGRSPRSSPGSPSLAPRSPGLLPRESGKLGDIRRSGGKSFPPVEYTPRRRLAEEDLESPTSSNRNGKGNCSNRDPLFTSVKTISKGELPPSAADSRNTIMPPVPARCASRVEERVKRATMSKSFVNLGSPPAPAETAQGWGARHSAV